MQFRIVYLLILFIVTSIGTGAQVSPSPHAESTQDLAGRLTPQQKQQYDDAMKAFNVRQYGQALSLYQSLLKELPGDSVLAKFSSEAALNAGDFNFALATLKPMTQSDPNDWQAAALLTRACAESGDKAGRDAGSRICSNFTKAV